MLAIHTECCARQRRRHRIWVGILLGWVMCGPAAQAADEACTAPDLQGADLTDLDCSQLDLSGRDLSPAPGPPEVKTQIQGTLFESSTLDGASLREVQGGCTAAACTDFGSASLRAVDFDEALLYGVDFEGADLTEALFSDADLRAANLLGANLDGAALASAALEGLHATGLVACPSTLPADWTCQASSLIGPAADLSGADLAGLILTDRFLVRAVFNDTSLTGTNFSGADLSDVTWTGADLTDAILTDATLQSVYPSSAISDLQLQAASSLLGVVLSLSDLTGFDLEGLDFSGADFRQARLSGTRFGLARLDATRFEFAQAGCTWGGSVSDPNCPSFAEASLAGADFGWARLDGAVFSGVTGDCVDDVCTVFQSALLRGSDFAAASLAGANFDGASLGQANLAAARFEDASFVLARLDSATAVCEVSPCGVVLDRADLEFASLLDVDFPSASLEGAQLAHADLTRARLTEAQLASANLESVLLSGVRLNGSDLSDAVLRAAEGVCIAAPIGSADTDPWCPDFAGASLIRADLSFARIDGAVMTAADLSEAVLVDALLDELTEPCTQPSQQGEGHTCMTISSPGTQPGTDMTGLVSRSSDWAGVDLSGARLPGADLSSSVFFVVRTIEPEAGPSFEEIYLADLSGADLTQAVLGQSDLTQVDLRGSLLARADLSGATLVEAIMDASTLLTAADFTSSGLAGADLRTAIFDDVDFAKGASLDQADCSLAVGGSPVDLVGARLAGADFSSAPEFLRGCISVDETTTYSLETLFPPFFDLQSEMTLVPEPHAFWLQATTLGGVALLRARNRRKSRPGCRPEG